MSPTGITCEDQSAGHASEHGDLTVDRTPSPAPARRIPLCEPVLGEQEKRRLAECIDSGFVSTVGPMVTEFERAFAARVGARNAVATASGTAALHVALRALDIREGDCVVVPDLTFVASVNPVLYCSGSPVLVDVSRETWCLDPALFDETCRKLARQGAPVKAVIPVHLYGCACDMTEIVRIAREQDIAVVEDATEALGTSLGGQQVGTFGHIGCFSFNGNKMMTTGAGGMVVTDDDSLAERVRYLVNQAKDAREQFVHRDMGYNYGMSNLAAAVGLAQLERLEARLAAKRRIAERYTRALEPLDGVALQPEPPDVENCFWLYSILLDSQPRRDAWQRSLAAQGIQTRGFFKPLHRQPYRPGRVHSRLGESPSPDAETASEYVAARGLHLPCSPNLTEPDQQFVIEQICAHY